MCNAVLLVLSHCFALSWPGHITSQIRLVNGKDRCSGRVEIYYSGQWGTVCDDSWDIKDAEVVCRQLDCGVTNQVRSSGQYGPGSGTIWLDDVACTGSERHLTECPHRGFGIHNCHHSEDAGVVCPAAEVRLVDGKGRCSGRVEIYHSGQWGTVCDDDWDMNDAAVVCGQLGCGSAVGAPLGAHFGQGSEPTWLDNVNCSGSESYLSECSHRSFGVEDCNHGEDAGVFCLSEIRLVNGTSHCCGVEILYKGQWGRVCGQKWDVNNANVVCGQLGCGRAVSAQSSVHLGQGSGGRPTWLDDVGCKGSEIFHSLLNFLLSFLVKPNRRLVNGSDLCSGRLEVYQTGYWRTVCNDVWDLNDAPVVCRQLGCGRADIAPERTYFGQGSGPIWQDDVGCSGSVCSITQCPHTGGGTHDCNHSNDAGVIFTSQIRLVNGKDRCSGRVEIYYSGQWGTVCDDSWDIKDAEVVCRQLDCGVTNQVRSSGQYGPGSGTIWLDDVACTGSERHLTECPHRGFGIHNCHHSEDAGVVCPAAEVRLVDGKGRCSGRVEIYHSGQWGTVCDDDWDMNDAAVVCGQLGCGSAVGAPLGAHFGQGSEPTWLDNVNCSGSESYLSECSHRSFGVEDCNHGEDAGVFCLSGREWFYHTRESCFSMSKSPFRCLLANSKRAVTCILLRSEIRLVNGTSHCCGVEILYKAQWGRVCGQKWDVNNANVVCGQLGCGRAVSAQSSVHLGQGSGGRPTWLDDVGCKGSESSLTEFYMFKMIFHSLLNFLLSFLVKPNRRLVNGSDLCSGRLEVYQTGYWRTVCNDVWDLNDAPVVCRQLGCGRADIAPERTYFGQGSGPIWQDDVGCSGSVCSITQCPHTGGGTHDCNHSNDAGVICSDQQIQCLQKVFIPLDLFHIVVLQPEQKQILNRLFSHPSTPIYTHLHPSSPK
uniref:SRCR domain-containing protein n=1 Tax=Oncorhynchus tshawytscha TaxID=74940 RepID=A0AAZ3Q886_ONCTS